jgi:hypothetical protein
MNHCPSEFAYRLWPLAPRLSPATISPGGRPDRVEGAVTNSAANFLTPRLALSMAKRGLTL